MLGHCSVVVTERYAHLKTDLSSASELGWMPIDVSAAEGKLVAFEPRPCEGALERLLSTCFR